jgi:hypothetical protein
MSPYAVLVDDNFHYMDEEARWEGGTFATAEEAVAACRTIVDEWLAHTYQPGMTSAHLYEQYTFFGDDPFVVPVGDGTERVLFSARDYARSRAEILCAGQAERRSQ